MRGVGRESLPRALSTLVESHGTLCAMRASRDEREGTSVIIPTTATIPLFPLDLVLFPGMELPLHVFEERYKRMMGLCLRENRDFGVVLARSQTDVPGQSLTHDVGTSAHIHGATRFADGRLNLETRGERRFQIVSFNWNLEYMTGEVRWLPEDDAADSSLRERAETQWNALRRRIAAITGEPITEVDLPADPSDAAYDLSGFLPVTNIEKQMLLEATNTDTRLREAIRLVVREHGILKFTTAIHAEIPQPTEGSVILPN